MALDTPDGNTAARTVVDFWFDPVCPWAWITSRWVLEAATVRPIEPRWHVMCLAMLNEQRDGLTEEYRRRMERSRGPVRVCIAAQRRRGDDVLLPLYTALGRRFHDGGQAMDDRGVLTAALAEAGLTPDLADAATSTEFDAVLRASHDSGQSLVGNDVGTPIVRVDGRAIFGPIVTPVPRGEAAGRLWDGLRLVLGTEGFFELKRTRDRKASFD